MKNVLFVSLGCDKNLVDSEKMLGLLNEAGYRVAQEESEADAIVVNTCCFIHDAKEESVETILEMAEWKKKGRLKALIVTGCMAQRYQDEIQQEIPEVDAVIGTTGYTEIVPILDEILAEAEASQKEAAVEEPKEKSFVNCCPSIDLLPASLADKRVVTTGGYTAYLKIAEGCNKNCTYCVIPSVRGRYRSVPMDELVTSAEELVAGGVKELILVAQETTLYGVDLYGKKCLHELLDRLNGISGLFWIRIMYCYPEEIYEELIDSMIKDKKVCHYLDMPVQHCNDTILQRMGRKTNKKELIERIHYLRKRVPDITLRTSLICGFPGETKEQHEELMQFVNDMEFDRLGAFTYSAEEGTPAAEMPDQVPQEQKEEWQADVMELQEEVIFDKNEAMKGTVLYAFIEGQVADENNTYVGRTYRDAPNVDGYIFINTDEELMSGDFARVRVTGALEYDLIGELI